MHRHALNTFHFFVWMLNSSTRFESWYVWVFFFKNKSLCVSTEKPPATTTYVTSGVLGYWIRQAECWALLCCIWFATCTNLCLLTSKMKQSLDVRKNYSLVFGFFWHGSRYVYMPPITTIKCLDWTEVKYCNRSGILNPILDVSSRAATSYSSSSSSVSILSLVCDFVST